MKEDYVSFKQANKLKELGFPQSVNDLNDYVYNCDGGIPMPLSYWRRNEYNIVAKAFHWFHSISKTREEDWLDFMKDYENGFIEVKDKWIARPTLSMVQKWLREEKGLDITPMPYIDDDHTKKYDLVIWKMFDDSLLNIYEGDETFDKYEDALSVGIDECIKELKSEK